ALRLEDAEVTLVQEGRPAFTVAGIAADSNPQGDGWQLRGNIHDPQWGPWTAEGRLVPRTRTATLRLDAERVTLSPGLLRGVPFVRLSVWDQVEVDGPARATVQLELGGPKGYAYRIEADPLSATVRVRAPGLEAERTTGHVVIEGLTVTLRDMRARTAGGAIELHGDLDFRKTPYRLALDGLLGAVDLQRFTRTWGLPEKMRQLSGRLTGAAKLVLSVSDRLHIDGRGEGRIDEA